MEPTEGIGLSIYPIRAETRETLCLPSLYSDLKIWEDIFSFLVEHAMSALLPTVLSARVVCVDGNDQRTSEDTFIECFFTLAPSKWP